jgi:hypothetical protein
MFCKVLGTTEMVLGLQKEKGKVKLEGLLDSQDFDLFYIRFSLNKEQDKLKNL